MTENKTTLCVSSKEDFEKRGTLIRELAQDQGLIPVTNRLTLFIDKTCRRWWFASRDSGVLISAEYGLVDKEAVNFLTNQLDS